MPFIVKTEEDDDVGEPDDDHGYQSYGTTPSTETQDNNNSDCQSMKNSSIEEPQVKLLMEKFEINGEIYEINYSDANANIETNGNDLVKDLKELKMEISKMKNLNTDIEIKIEDDIDVDEFEATDYQIPPGDNQLDSDTDSSCDDLDMFENGNGYDISTSSPLSNTNSMSVNEIFVENTPSTSNVAQQNSTQTSQPNAANSISNNSVLTIKTEDLSSIDSELSSPTTSDMSSSIFDPEISIKEENADSSFDINDDMDDYEMIQAFCEPILDEGEQMMPDMKIKQEFDDVINFINGYTNDQIENCDEAGPSSKHRKPRFSDILPTDATNPSDMAAIAPETTGLFCKLCNTKFSQPSSLIRHMRIHTGKCK